MLVRGNHDAESVITKAITLPETVRTFSTKKPETLRFDHLKVALHGQSFPNRAVDDNLSLGYPAAVPGWFNIGVLHTSCTGHAQHATYAPCSIADLRSRGYDYWALGHIHEYAELSRDPWILFPGNLQGRSVRECGPKGAVAVEVADGQVSQVRRLIVDHARFHILAVPVDGTETEGEAVARVEAALRPLAGLAEDRLLAVRVHLTGTTIAHDRLAADRENLTAEIQAAADRVHADIWLETLKIETVRPSSGPRESVVDAIDPVTLLAEIDRDPEFRARAEAALAEIAAKLPPTDEGDLAGDLDALCAEAEAMILGRLTKRAC